jgi:heme oxygenase
MEKQLSQVIKMYSISSHQKLEKRIIGLLKDIEHKEDYSRLLMFFYNYFHKLEILISNIITPDILPDYLSRRKTQLIKNDIADNGFELVELPIEKLPYISSPLEAMSALYVMEGSTLGGSAIVKILEKKGLVHGTSFFAGYQEETANRWCLFLESFNAMVSKDDNPEVKFNTAVFTVINTFDCFLDMISTHLEFKINLKSKLQKEQ